MKLSKLNENVYCIYDKGYSFEGNTIQIIEMMQKIGIDIKDIQYGFEAVQEYDYADYGLNGVFIIGGNFKKRA